MCRTHRLFVAVTVATWALLLTLILVSPHDPHWQWKMATVLVGSLAVVMLPYIAFPYLASEMLEGKLEDVAGAYLAGWQAAQEEQHEPKEPTRLHSVR